MRKALTLIIRGIIALFAALLIPVVAGWLSADPADVAATTAGYWSLVAVAWLFFVLVQWIIYLLPLEAVADTREEGVVKWFNGAKGFGFITRENADDVFVHFRSIRGRGHRTLHEGQRVRFGVVESKKGLQADDVSVIRHT